MNDSTSGEILNRLNAASKDRFVSIDKDDVYAALRIRSAGELNRVSPTDLGLSRTELEQLQRLVYRLALSKIPPAYPADEHFLRILEGIERPPPVSDNRAALNYCHHKTRDGILARLRSSYFQDMLEHFKPAVEGKPGSHDTLIRSFIENVVARRLQTYLDKIGEVLRFSVYEEDWSDDQIRWFSRLVMADLLGWFLADPAGFVDAPGEARIALLPRDTDGSMATSLNRACIENLRFLREVTLSRATNAQVSPERANRYRLLKESSWYRYFFFDEDGLDRWVRSGVLGFDKAETFEDFVEKLRARSNWKEVILPLGERVDDAGLVDAARQIGTYAVELKDGTMIDVEVSILPNLTVAELEKFLRQGAIRVAKKVWLVSPPNARSESYSVRRVGRGWSENGRYFFAGRSAIALVRTPAPGRYEFRERGTESPVAVLDATDFSVMDVHGVFLPELEAFRLKVLFEGRLAEGAFDQPLEIGVRGAGPERRFPLSSRVVDAVSSVYMVQAEVDLPYSDDLLGTELELRIPALSWEGRLLVPSLISVLEAGQRLKRLQPDDGIPAMRSWRMRLYARGSVILRTPAGSVEVAPGATKRIGELELTSVHEGRHLRLDFTEGPGPGTEWIEFAPSGGAPSLRIYRVSAVAVRIDGEVVEGGEYVAPVTGSHACRLDVYPEVHRAALVSVTHPSGKTISFATETGRDFEFDFDEAGLYRIRVEAPPLPPVSVTMACAGALAVSGPTWIESGQMGGPFVVRSGIPLRLVQVRGLVDLACSPKIGTEATEFSIWGKALGPPRRGQRVDISLEYKFPSGNKSPLSVVSEVDIVGVAIRVDNEPFAGQIVHEYSGESILAWGLHRTIFARYGNLDVPLPGAGAAPADLTRLLPRDAEVATIQFLVQEGTSQILLKRTLTVSRRYFPTLLLPDGIEGGGAGGCPLGITPPADRLSVLLVSENGNTKTERTLRLSQGCAFLPHLTAPARLQVRRGDAPIPFFFEGERRELLLKPWSEVPKSAHYAVSFDGELQPIEGIVADPEPKRLIELCQRFGTIVVDEPPFGSRLRIIETAVTLGWRFLCSLAYRPLLEALTRESLQLVADVFDFEEDSRDTRPAVVLLDASDSLRLLARSGENRGGPRLFLVPAGWSERRSARRESLAKLFKAVMEGVISDPTDMSQWARLGPAVNQMLVEIAYERGVEGVVVAAINECLGDAVASGDRRAAETVNALLRRSDLLLRMPPAERATLQDRIVSLVESMLHSTAAELPRLKELIAVLTDGVSLSDLGVEGIRGSLEYLRSRAELEFLRLEAADRIGDAAELLERLEIIFPSEVRYPLERAVLHYSYHDTVSKRRMVAALRRAFSIDEAEARAIADRRGGPYRHLVSNRWCECGEIRWLTRQVCPSCGATW